MAGMIGWKCRHWLAGLGLLLAGALLAQLAPLQERIDEAEALRDRDPAAAAEQLQALLREALGAGDELAVAESRRALAVQYNILGRNPEAQRLLREALADFERLHRPDRAALTQRHLGVVHYDSGRFDEATAAYLAALRLLDGLDLPMEEAKTRANLGNVYYAMERFDEAIEVQRQAMAVFSEAGLDIGVAGTAMNLGASLLARQRRDGGDGQADLTEAKAAFSASLAIFSKLGNPRGELKILSNLGRVATMEGDLLEAERHYRQALALALKIDESVEAQLAELRLWRVLARQGRTDEVLLQVERRLAELSERGEGAPVDLLELAAELHEGKDQPARALAWLKQAHQRREAIAEDRMDSRIAELQARFEGERLAAENENLRQASEIAQLSAARERVRLYAAVAVATLALLLAVAMVQTLRLRERVRRKLDHAARHDPLTGCLNRRGLRQGIEALPQPPAFLLIFDLDGFKQLNDQHGHDRGDAVLAAIPGRVRARLDKTDLLCRWGGEEFLILRASSGDPGVAPGMHELAEGLRAVIADCPFDAAGESVRVTISVGAAMVGPERPFSDALHAADQALLRAKREGRNRVVVSDD